MSDRIETDTVLHGAMLANGLEKPGEQVDLEGDLYRTTHASQRDSRGGVVGFGEMVATEGAAEVALHTVLKKAHDAVVKPGWLVITAGAETIASALRTILEGDEIGKAIKREYGVGACFMLCESALPPGFKEDLFSQFFKRGEASPGAAVTYRAILARPDAAAIIEGMVANCRDGQRYALDRRIVTLADLAVALQQNPELTRRYQDDLAFKLGVDSAIWAAAHGQLPALEAEVSSGAGRDSIEVRG